MSSLVSHTCPETPSELPVGSLRYIAYRNTIQMFSLQQRLICQETGRLYDKGRCKAVIQEGQLSRWLNGKTNMTEHGIDALENALTPVQLAYYQSQLMRLQMLAREQRSL